MSEIELADYSYDDISVGKTFSFTRTLNDDDVQAFSALTGDSNPLHMDEAYAKTTRFEGRIVHGMLAGSLFSTLVGMVCPGKKNLYLSQSLQFRKPIRIDSTLTVSGEVVQKLDAAKMIVIRTAIACGDDDAITGEAKVMVMER